MKALLTIAALFVALTAGIMVAGNLGFLSAAQVAAETCSSAAGKAVDIGIKGIEFAVDTVKSFR